MTDLICSHYTVAGVSPLVGAASPRPFEDFVRACAEGAYSGLGMHVRDHHAMRKAAASDHGLGATTACAM